MGWAWAAMPVPHSSPVVWQKSRVSLLQRADSHSPWVALQVSRACLCCSKKQSINPSWWPCAPGHQACCALLCLLRPALLAQHATALAHARNIWQPPRCTALLQPRRHGGSGADLHRCVGTTGLYWKCRSGCLGYYTSPHCTHRLLRTRTHAVIFMHAVLGHRVMCSNALCSWCRPWLQVTSAVTAQWVCALVKARRWQTLLRPWVVLLPRCESRKAVGRRVDSAPVLYCYKR